MKYKVGDKVVISEYLNVWLDCLSTVVDDMVQYKGRVATIVKIEEDNVYKLDVDRCEWEWNAEMF